MILGATLHIPTPSTGRSVGLGVVAALVFCIAEVFGWAGRVTQLILGCAAGILAAGIMANAQ